MCILLFALHKCLSHPVDVLLAMHDSHRHLVGGVSRSVTGVFTLQDFTVELMISDPALLLLSMLDIQIASFS